MNSLKKMLFLLVSLLVVFTACSDDDSSSHLTDSEAVMDACLSLEVGYSGADNATNVNENVTLITNGANGTKIIWFSTNTSLVSINGIVTRPVYGTSNAEVALIAVVSKGDIIETKTFNLLVKVMTATSVVAANMTALEIGYAGSDSASSVTLSLALPTSGSSGATVSWFSFSENIIATDGIVRRPLNGSGDAPVVLVAVIIKDDQSETKTFNLTVKEAPPEWNKINYTTGSGNPTFNMVFVAGGLSFPTGTNDSGTAMVTNGYQIAETETTYELWYAVRVWSSTNGYSYANSGAFTSGYPVISINWHDSMVWCNALTDYYNKQNNENYGCVYKNGSGAKITNSTDANGTECDVVIPDVNANGFRLLTSNEWELSARYLGTVVPTIEPLATQRLTTEVAGTTYYWTPGSYASGATDDYNDATTTGAVAWYSVNSSSHLHSVKDREANALGLYDMSGNAWEFCFDIYNGTDRVVLGGGYPHAAVCVQVGSGTYGMADFEYGHIGFRIARTP